jgi:uncharacterized membrane protein YhaH (DUF805 family)
MLRALFGSVTDGKLARLPFLGYWVLLAAAVVVVLLGIGAAIGVAEQMVGGDLHSAQVKLGETLGIPGLLLISVIFAVLLFAGANLKAKRIRDIGLPGWWTLLAILVVDLCVSLISQQAAQAFSSLVILALLLIPGNAFSGKSGQPG